MLDETTQYYEYFGLNAPASGGSTSVATTFIYDPLTFPNVFIFIRGGHGDYTDSQGIHPGIGGAATLNIRPETMFSVTASDHSASISASVTAGSGSLGGGAASFDLQDFEYDFGNLQLYITATGGAGGTSTHAGDATIRIHDNRVGFFGAITQIGLTTSANSPTANQSGAQSISFSNNIITGSDQANSIGFLLSGQSTNTPNTQQFQAVFSENNFNLGAGNDQLLFVVDNGARLSFSLSSFDGGEGFDVLSFSDPLGVTVDMFQDGFHSFEFVIGGDGNDTIDGNDEATAFYAGAGTNHVDGRDGNDTFFLGTGSDTYVGGQGTDTLDMSFSSVGANVALWTGQASGDGNASVSGIENVIGTAFADHIEGDLVNNDLIGLEGNDELAGLGGFDLLEGGLGDDKLDGSGGVATAVYGRGTEVVNNALTDGVTVFLSVQNAAQNTGYFGWDTLLNITNAWGTNANDTIIGSAIDNELVGFDGDDYLAGLAGNDRLIGGEGNDIIDGGVGIDTAYGGFGNDFYYVDNAADDITELAGGGVDTIIASTSYAMRNWTEVLFLQGPAALNARGTNTADVIFGNDLANQIDGLAGSDLLFGGQGDDIYYADTPGDIVFENLNEGNDTIFANSGYYLFDNIENLVLGENTLPFGLGDFLTQVAGSLFNFSNDFFGVGNALDNILTGNSGANLLLGGAGVDTVHGNGGNDTLFGEDGADQLYGDAGIDFLTGGAGDDHLNGGDNADALYGEDGNDYLDGGTSFDTDILVGGAGNDTLYGISGQANPDYDLIDGGSGDDVYWVDTGADLTFEALDGGIDTVHADITVPNAGVYLYANVENLVLEGTTAFGVGNELDNVLTGSASGNWLLGGAGNDTINGLGGNDVLYGEAGNDTFVFGIGNGGDVIGDFASGQDHIQLNGQYANFVELQAHFIQNGNVGAIDLGGGNLIVLHNVTMSNLTAADFIFAAVAEPAPKSGSPVMEPLGDWGGGARADLFADAILYGNDDLHWHRPQAEALI